MFDYMYVASSWIWGEVFWFLGGGVVLGFWFFLFVCCCFLKLKEASENREKLPADAYITFSCLASDTDSGKRKKLKCKACSIARDNRGCLKLAGLYTDTYPLAAAAQGSVKANSGSCDCSINTLWQKAIHTGMERDTAVCNDYCIAIYIFLRKT